MSAVEEFSARNAIECIKEYDIYPEPRRPIFFDDMGPRAVKAARGLLDLESRLFVIDRTCINTSDGDPDPEDVSAGRRISVVYNVLESSGWDVEKLLVATRAAARIFHKCGIYFNDIRVTMIRTTDAYDAVEMEEFFQLVSSTRASEFPHVYFLNRQALTKNSIRGRAYIDTNQNWWNRNQAKLADTVGLKTTLDLEYLRNVAIVVGNHRSKGDKRYLSRTKTLGRTIAHELYHIFGDCFCHEKDSDNFMYPGGKGTDLFINAAQCSNTRSGIRRLRGREIQNVMSIGD